MTAEDENDLHDKMMRLRDFLHPSDEAWKIVNEELNKQMSEL